MNARIHMALVTAAICPIGALASVDPANDTFAQLTRAGLAHDLARLTRAA